MKFLNDLSQKKLARAIMCGLMVGGGMLAGTGTKVGRIENFQNMNFYSRNSGSRSQYAYRWCRLQVLMD